ncbi:MAG: hypothetical protein ACK4SI_05770 [Brevundimonas aurantiaca]|jgi:hypothetical protein|uniref:hypothetical protein n=2 Tax=Caulobacteraceae TaxID=76892 RepID=UPI0006D2617C|nr:hypothetical protein JL11_13145 [Brevundimonas sp. DS20]QFU32520.1 hypothetical protein BSP_12695 [Brevundimonas sp. Bb-A]
MTGLQMKTLLVTAASALALAACGSAEVASPGEGNFGNGGNNGGNNGGGNTPAPGTPAADCPTGLANVGTIANGSLRVCQLPQQILGNLSLAVRAGTIYSISGRTEVGTDRGIDPASTTGTQGILTIEPGVKIFASSGGDYLLVNRGSQIYAEGTSTKPIIFTSRQDVEGTATATSQGQWGGIVLAGRAPQANCQLTAPVTCTGQVEGTNAFYGGNTATDNSGRLRYVQIKYSGFEISTGNELQALTLAGVGSGTTLEYIQSYNSSDDGIEIFGGNANLKHIVINGADDDGLDTDTGWRGGAQFGIVTQRAPNSTSRSAGFEFSSAPKTTAYAARYLSQPKIANWTLVGRNAASDVHTVMHFDTGTQPTLMNIVATSTTGSVAGCFDIEDADTQTSFDGNASPSLRSIYMSCSVSYRPANVARSTAVFTNARNTNVTAAGTSTLTAPASGTTIANQNLAFINGANENAVTAIDPKTVYSFFDSVNYIGAVRNAQDTWWQGWTCGLTAGSPC